MFLSVYVMMKLSDILAYNNWSYLVNLKVKLFVSLLFICALPGKAIPEIAYTMLSGTLNPTQTHSFTHFGE